MTSLQQLQIIRTSIVWSGCGTYSYCHPLRIIVHLGELRVAALVDTGSDYDAIDMDLSKLQAESGNPSFRSRKLTGPNPVRGFKTDLRSSTDQESEWEVTLKGSPVYGGKPEKSQLIMQLSEFQGLSDPMIIGLPTIDKYGGMEVLERPFGLQVCGSQGISLPRGTIFPHP